MVEKKIPENIEKILEDIDKYCKKANAMIIESAVGPSPQILKMIVLQKVVDKYFNLIKGKYSEKKIKEAYSLMDSYLASTPIKVINDIKEVEKNL